MVEQGRSEFGAFVLDMDGVVTNTAVAHLAAWRGVFDDLLRQRAGDTGLFAPFTRADYLAHVDGVPRYRGVRRFLDSRGIDMPDGDPDDVSGLTVHGLGNLKNIRFRAWLERNGVAAFDDARTLIGALRRNGIVVGVFSASRNARRILEAARVRELFQAVVDGTEAEELGLPGKPDPAMLVETARRLGCAPKDAAVVEDAVSGIAAGAKGGFGLVVGVNRQLCGAGEQRHALRAHGADLVVHDLCRLLTDDGSGLRTARRLPKARDRAAEFEARIGPRPVAVFLDFDGTLTPIGGDGCGLDISGETVETVAELARRIPTAIISSRDLPDIRARVGLDLVFYAGSNGIDIAGPGGLRHRPERAEALLLSLEAAEVELRGLAETEHAEIERRAFSISVHFRDSPAADADGIEQAVDGVVERHPILRKVRGRKFLEVQAQADWDKGRTVEWLLRHTPLGQGDPLPLYIGRDLTDEDAFAAIRDRGVSIIVRGGDRLTTADYALDDTDDLRRFLGWLSKRVAEPAS